MKKIVEKFRLNTLVKLIICIVAISFCFSCQTKQQPKKQIRYVIDYGGFFGGRYTTSEYKLKDGYYLFLYNGDSIRLKESEVELIRKKQ